MTNNRAPKATLKIIDDALELGLIATAIQRSTGHHRRSNPLGSVSVPQKIVVINSIRMSVSQARQYLAARSNH